jgi:hypothetical protein
VSNGRRLPSVLDLWGASPDGNWVEVFRADDGPLVECVDGVWWHEAPAPRRWHRCRAQTRALMTSAVDRRPLYIERCACGAIREGARGLWWERNNRRR